MSLCERQDDNSNTQRVPSRPNREAGPPGSASQTFSAESAENSFNEQTGMQTESRRASRSPTPEVTQLSDKEKQILDSLEKIVDEFRRNRRSKIESITSIVEEINKSGLEENFARQALTSYIGLLESTEKKERLRRKRASHREKTEKRGGQQQHDERLDETEDIRYNDGRQKERSCVNERKEQLGGNPSDDERGKTDTDNESENSNFDRGEPKTKKRKIKESDFPWYEEERLARENEDSRCYENWKLLQFYLKNLTAARRQITVSRRAPCNFPSAEWDKLFKGELADFDSIYSSIHHVGAPRENRGRFGDREIILGYSDPVRKVEDLGQWTVAANLYGEALSFAWPSRREEWFDHLRYIDFTPVSLSSKKQLGLASAQEQECYSLIEECSTTSEMPYSTREVSVIVGLCEKSEGNHPSTDQSEVQQEVAGPFVKDGTQTSGAHSIQINASGDMCAEDAEGIIKRRNARKTSQTEVLKGNIPKYLRFNYYDASRPLPLTLLEWSLTAKPLPSPPKEELENSRVCATLLNHQDLFKIVTPIRADVLRRLVEHHPN
ncbi:hypothetical protein C0993_003271 [Termitomyces sp. T159_Od127]|nr:hypothetical protein C0993_003271 [Termitomyces sp. T159_Od127]